MLLAVICISLMMLLISADTLGRYIFSKPISGANEIVTLYLIVGVVFIGLSNTFKANEHISVDIVVNKLPGVIKKPIAIFVHFIGLLLFIFICYQSWLVTYHAFISNESYIGAVTFPLYTAYGLVPLGCLFIVIRLLLKLLIIITGYKEESSS